MSQASVWQAVEQPMTGKAHKVALYLLVTILCALISSYSVGDTATQDAAGAPPEPTYEQVRATLPELPERFGNPVLRGWHEISGPAPISWLPTALGWRLLAAIILLWLIRRGWQLLRLWWRNRYRREALKRLARSKHCPVAINEILKLAAMAASSRREVASLSGHAWLAWLEQRAPRLTLSNETKTLLVKGLYKQSELAPSAAFSADAKEWLQQHRDDHVGA
jgi:hypothetical protein